MRADSLTLACLAVLDEPTVSEHPWKATLGSSSLSPRSARGSQSSRRRRLKADAAGGPGFSGSGSGLPALVKGVAPAPAPVPEPESEPEPEPAPEPEAQAPTTERGSPDSIVAFKAAGNSMRPYRKGWILHKQHGVADARMASIELLQEQMMVRGSLYRPRYGQAGVSV